MLSHNCNDVCEQIQYRALVRSENQDQHFIFQNDFVI